MTDARMYKWLFKKVMMPVGEFASGISISKHYSNLNRSQWMADADISKLQDRRLSNLFRHAYRTTDYYRKSFNDNNLENFNKIKLDNLPTLTKYDIRDNQSSLMLKVE